MPTVAVNRLNQFVVEESLVGSPLGNFGHFKVWDAQRFGTFENTDQFRDAATIYIGVYSAAAGIPESMGQQIQNDYAHLYSDFREQTMSTEYTSLPVRNVVNFDIGHQSFLTGRVP